MNDPDDATSYGRGYYDSYCTLACIGSVFAGRASWQISGPRRIRQAVQDDCNVYRWTRLLTAHVHTFGACDRSATIVRKGASRSWNTAGPEKTTSANNEVDHACGQKGVQKWRPAVCYKQRTFVAQVAATARIPTSYLVFEFRERNDGLPILSRNDAALIPKIHRNHDTWIPVSQPCPWLQIFPVQSAHHPNLVHQEIIQAVRSKI
ncbi:hypothetical protein ACLOJK_013542 [Asimina triloba]